MNAQDRTPGADLRTSDDDGRGNKWLVALVVVVIAGVVVLIVL